MPAERINELRGIFEAALKANQAFQLAQKEWEAKYNAWVAAEYKLRYEMGVPQNLVLNLEAGVFEPKATTDLPANLGTTPKKGGEKAPSSP